MVMSRFYSQFVCSNNPEFSIIIEDDGKVAYAYMINDNKIIADVWLYNCKAAPTVTKWDKNKMPFLNPMEFLDTSRHATRIRKAEDVSIDWKNINDNKLIEATISVNNGVLAKLLPGARPGWSAIVSKDGPLANKMAR